MRGLISKIALAVFALGFLGLGLKTYEEYPKNSPVLVSHALQQYSTPACVANGIAAQFFVFNPEDASSSDKKLNLREDVFMMEKSAVPIGYRPEKGCVKVNGFVGAESSATVVLIKAIIGYF